MGRNEKKLNSQAKIGRRFGGISTGGIPTRANVSTISELRALADEMDRIEEGLLKLRELEYIRNPSLAWGQDGKNVFHSTRYKLNDISSSCRVIRRKAIEAANELENTIP